MKDLKELIKICRANGVSEVEYQGIKLILGPMPIKNRKAFRPAPSPDTDVVSFDPGPIPVQQVVQETIEADGLEGEDLLFYSADARAEQ